jgi:ABC-2 type transport system ATP-binding protein
LLPAVRVQGLRKVYRGGVVANDGIDLDVSRGAVFGLLGPNGAGKTTLVRQITGELEPTAGQVSVLGVDVVREPLRAKALMGVVPQEANPVQYMTAAEHFAYFGRLQGLSGETARARADVLMRELGLEAHARKEAEMLSGGLKRKLLVGMALVAEPPLLVLDEPTTGLDPTSRREVWALVRSLRRRGVTVLVTTHYMEEAEHLCDSVAVIGAGRILAEGSVESLRARCRSQYKAVYEDGDGLRQAVYGAHQREVTGALERLGVAEYHLSRTTLEDLYLELTGNHLEEAAIA